MDYMLDEPDYVECSDCGEVGPERSMKHLSDVRYEPDPEGLLRPVRVKGPALCRSCFEQYNPAL